MDQLYRFREAAEMLAVSSRTIERLVEDGALPLIRVRGGRRVRESDLTTFIGKSAQGGILAGDAR